MIWRHELSVTDEEAGYLNDYCVETTEIYDGTTYDRANDLPGGGTYLMNGIQAVAYTVFVTRQETTSNVPAVREK